MAEQMLEDAQAVCALNRQTRSLHFAAQLMPIEALDFYRLSYFLVVPVPLSPKAPVYLWAPPETISLQASRALLTVTCSPYSG